MLLRPIGDGTLPYSASLGGVLRLLGASGWELGFGIVVSRILFPRRSRKTDSLHSMRGFIPLKTVVTGKYFISYALEFSGSNPIAGLPQSHNFSPSRPWPLQQPQHQESTPTHLTTRRQMHRVCNAFSLIVGCKEKAMHP